MCQQCPSKHNEAQTQIALSWDRRKVGGKGINLNENKLKMN